MLDIGSSAWRVITRLLFWETNDFKTLTNIFYAIGEPLRVRPCYYKILRIQTDSQSA